MYQSNVDLGLQTGSLKTFLFKKYGIVTKALFLHVCICNFFLCICMKVLIHVPSSVDASNIFAPNQCKCHCSFFMC